MSYTLLSLNDLHKSYGDKRVLNNISLRLNRATRSALVGENGVGKTTLARLIIGQEWADSGTITLAPSASLGYLPQEVSAPVGISIEQYIAQALGELYQLEAQLEALGAALANPFISPEQQAEHLAQYAEVQDAYERRGGYELPLRLAQVMAGLSIDYLEQSRQLTSLSGGERTRVALCALLLQAPDVLILDEPTNHLDFAGIAWLEGYLRNYAGALLLIAHDRAFLDAVATHIIELSALTHSTQLYHGNYSAYVAQREREQAQALDAYEARLEEMNRLSRLIKHTQHNTRSQPSISDGDKFMRYKMAQTAQKTRSAKIRDAEQRLTVLEDDKLDNPRRTWRIEYAFQPAPLISQTPLNFAGVSHAYAERTLFSDASATLYKGQRVALVAPNGTGKSTLLRLLAGQEALQSGTVERVSASRLAYLSQDGEELPADQRALDCLRDASPMPMDERQAQAELHRAGLWGDSALMRKRVAELSMGQKRKLGLARLIASQANVLLLDEPTNHLDLLSLEALEEALCGFGGALIAATHDRRFIERVANQIWRIEAGRLIVEL
jgi:macrolide transport system ATP-binding/permease protein